MSTYKREYESRIVNELRRIQDIKEKRFCSRHEVMEEINFPETNQSRIIIKSNEKGTGFMRNHYHEQYCPPYITKKEFDAIVDKASLIIGNEYSRKRKLDTQGMGLWVQLSLVGTFILGLVFIIMGYYLDQHGPAYEAITYIICGISWICSISILLYNFLKPFQESSSFEDMVYRKVGEYFNKVNEKWNPKNLDWLLIPGHYWIEVRMLDKPQEEDMVNGNKFGHENGLGNETNKGMNGGNNAQANLFNDEDED